MPQYRSVSILTKEDVQEDEHVCPNHGPMEPIGAVRKDGLMWMPRKPWILFCCPGCMKDAYHDMTGKNANNEVFHLMLARTIDADWDDALEERMVPIPGSDK